MPKRKDSTRSAPAEAGPELRAARPDLPGYGVPQDKKGLLP